VYGQPRDRAPSGRARRRPWATARDAQGPITISVIDVAGDRPSPDAGRVDVNLLLTNRDAGSVLVETGRLVKLFPQYEKVFLARAPSAPIGRCGTTARGGYTSSTTSPTAIVPPMTTALSSATRPPKSSTMRWSTPRSWACVSGS
jgi:hypothetical protein